MKTNRDRPRRQARRPEAAALDAAAAAVRDHVARNGLRRSATRDLVVETFLASADHASVEELTARVRARDPAVGQATVYRTLRLLQECGVAAARRFGDGATRFEPVLARPHHDHLICTACGDILEFENPEIEALQLEVARRHGFTTEAHRMELYGRCARCRRARRTEAS
ncbi:MAG TPA: transcriptional repressor [Anaeromyxobacter sp.]|nr:transcriptional repressor [Anaeromyxobacter sp.]